MNNFFFTKMSQYSHYTYCLEGESTDFGLKISMPKMSQYSHCTYCLQEQLVV